MNKSIHEFLFPANSTGGRHKAYVPNHTALWLPADSEELFKANLIKNPTHPTLQYYLDNPIVYRYNNFGFRTDYQFKKGEKVNVFLGCSYTTGVGLSLEDTWGYKINKHTGGNFANLSVGGGSINTSYRILNYFKDFFDIERIFILQPFKERFDIYYVNLPYTLYPGHIRNKEILGNTALGSLLSDDLLVNGFLSNRSIEANYEVHLQAIKYIAESRKVPLYLCNDLGKIYSTESKYPRARDLMHPGKEVHKLYTEYFINLLEN